MIEPQILSQAYRCHRDYFDSASANWKIKEEDLHRAVEIFSQIEFHSDEKILDVGCGTGSLFPVIKQFAPKSTLIGCDMSVKMLARSRDYDDNKRIPIVQCLGEILPFKDESIDVVLNYCIYPHLKFRMTAFHEFHRVLKKEGRYFIIQPHGREAVNRTHRRLAQPVCFDILPTVEETVWQLMHTAFSVSRIVDSDNLFLIEVNK
jgi:ubiquinone/menaquinone biosynthesis C-methylase UbiE